MFYPFVGDRESKVVHKADASCLKGVERRVEFEFLYHATSVGYEMCETCQREEEAPAESEQSEPEPKATESDSPPWD